MTYSPPDGAGPTTYSTVAKKITAAAGEQLAVSVINGRQAPPGESGFGKTWIFSAEPELEANEVAVTQTYALVLDTTGDTRDLPAHSDLVLTRTITYTAR